MWADAGCMAQLQSATADSGAYCFAAERLVMLKEPGLSLHACVHVNPYNCAAFLHCCMLENCTIQFPVYSAMHQSAVWGNVVTSAGRMSSGKSR